MTGFPFSNATSILDAWNVSSPLSTPEAITALSPTLTTPALILISLRAIIFPSILTACCPSIVNALGFQLAFVLPSFTSVCAAVSTELYSLLKEFESGVNTDNEPTFNTPLAPTTIPLGETNTKCPLLNPPFSLFKAFTTP